MSKLVAKVRESELRTLDRWVLYSIAAMGIGPLLPYAIGGL